MSENKAATEIRKVYSTYRTLPGTNQYMMISEIENRADLTREQIREGILALLGEPGFLVLPESNQKALSPEARAAAVNIGNQDKHLIAWV